MTVKILIVDPDIAFSVPIKRALEASGDYKVSVFASGGAALELLEHDPHDIAVIDAKVSDMALPQVIEAMRRARPDVFVILSANAPQQFADAPEVRATILKPYFARQLAPLIRDAQGERAQTPQAAARPDLPESQNAAPTIGPDATFRRVLDTVHQTGERPAPEATEEALPLPEGATVRSLVSGEPPAQPGQPESLPEAPQPVPDDTSSMAQIALEVASDDTVPLHNVTKAVAERVEAIPPEDRPPVLWMAAEGSDQPTLIGATSAVVVPPMLDEPGFVAKVIDERLPDEFPIAPTPEAPPKPLPESTSYDEEIAMTFAPLLPPDEQPGAEPPADVPIQTPHAAETGPEPAPAELTPSEAPAVTDPIATAALQLTHLTVESAAQASLLSRAGELVAQAGLLSDDDVRAVLEELKRAWQGTDPKTALFRYVQLAGATDYLLYSVQTINAMTLTMLFPGDVPLKTIRKQARELRAALEHVPEPEGEAAPPPAEEPEAAKTLPSRPTDLRPPEGLREAIEAPAAAPDTAATTQPEQQTESPGPQAAAGEALTAEATPPQAAAPPEGPYSAYTFMWLPRREMLAPETASLMHDWLNNIAEAHFWKIEGAEIQGTYIAIQVSIPVSESAAGAVETLMRETAARAGDSELWAEAYYIVNGGRAITPQEVASFMEYRRESQSIG